MLNYSKVFICDFGEAELFKSDPNPAEIGCDVNCSPGESFEVCVLKGAEGEVRVGAMPVNNGESQAYTCVPWKGGKASQMLIVTANEQEQILLASFDIDEIRAFRKNESWRMDYRCQGPGRHIAV